MKDSGPREISRSRKINRFVDIISVIFNSLVALLILTAPWYVMEYDEVFRGCNLTEGTALAPFVSGICGVDMTDLKTDGTSWGTVLFWSTSYFTLSCILLFFVVFEVVMFGIRSSDNAYTIAFILNLVLIIHQGQILGKANNTPKPEKTVNTTAQILLIIATSLTVVRMLVLMVLMYRTKTRRPKGVFGTGAAVPY